jgi:hypothetical protein
MEIQENRLYVQLVTVDTVAIQTVNQLESQQIITHEQPVSAYMLYLIPCGRIVICLVMTPTYFYKS